MLVADDLTPSQTMQIDREKILALVCVHGSENSHTAILVRMMNVPALIGVPVNLEEVQPGMHVLVDGFQGEVIFEPPKEICAETEKRIRKEQEKQALLHTLKGKENRTLDGKRIDIYANVGSIEDVSCALENDAGGIGLFRSEFLYLGRNDYPTEEEQFRVYRQRRKSSKPSFGLFCGRQYLGTWRLCIP